MKSVKIKNTGSVAKVPQVQSSDDGAYVCTVRLWGNSSHTPFAFHVNVIVDGEADLRGRKAKSLWR